MTTECNCNFPSVRHPLETNRWFKTEKHNSSNFRCMVSKMTENIINVTGITIYYYPVSEYTLNGVAALWGEDPDRTYKEKYILKAFSEDNADSFKFNSMGGLDKSDTEKVIFLHRNQFEYITGRDSPLPEDNLYWSQNGVIYQVVDVSDQENIILGNEIFWRLVITPRIVAGEEYASECDPTRTPIEDFICGEEFDGHEGSIDDDPEVEVPGPTEIKDDVNYIEGEKADIIIRTEWGTGIGGRQL
jgi:hypothetical protein